MEDTAGSLRMWLGPPSVDNPRRCESSRPFHTHFEGAPAYAKGSALWVTISFEVDVLWLLIWRGGTSC